MKLRIGLCQILVGTEKAQNIQVARLAIAEAVSKGANLVSLPECFNSVYAVNAFEKYAELVPDIGERVKKEEHPTTSALLEISKEHKIYLIGGSIPERGIDGLLYNTCVVSNPQGEIIAKHRKMHLFDIDIPGGIRFQESETLSAGNTLTTFDTPWCKVGLGICYDMRFPQLASILSSKGCKVLVYPGAFNMVTGPAHWELLQRARAIDNQLFVCACSPARNPNSEYKAWGHSTLVNPWGEVIMTTGHDPAVIVSDELDVDEQCDKLRKSIPISVQSRKDLYTEAQWRDGESPLLNKRVKK
jgi:omega-amidase